MKGVVSQFVLFFFIMIMLWVGIAYVSQNMQYSSARQYYREVIYQLQISDFAKQKKLSCVAQAKRRGYELEILSDAISPHDARVRLVVPFTYPLIHRKTTYVIDGYAR